MASSNIMPELINNYQVFDDTTKTHRLLGVTGEVELPSLESITDSIEVSGGLVSLKHLQLGSMLLLS